MSGYPAPVAEKRAPVDTGSVLLTKPFKRQELADAVAAALASQKAPETPYSRQKHVRRSRPGKGQINCFLTILI